jgi:uncharacterized membrane protein YesL
MWDNPAQILLLNAGYLLIAGLFILLTYLMKSSVAMLFLIMILGIISICIYSGITALMTKEISDYKQPRFNDFIRFFRESWQTSFVFSLILSLYVLLMLIALPFYLDMNHIGGLIAIITLFWISCGFILAFQYFFVVNARLEKDTAKIIKKCFMLFLDNPVFSITLLFGSVIIIVLSGFFGFLLPGFSAVFIWMNTGLKLRLYKYDYIMAHPDRSRREIPWTELIQEEFDAVGKRTLKGMIFPWKG